MTLVACSPALGTFLAGVSWRTAGNIVMSWKVTSILQGIVCLAVFHDGRCSINLAWLFDNLGAIHRSDNRLDWR